MGLATIDPHGLKEHIEIHKIPKFGVNRPNRKQDTAIEKCQNFTKKCMAYRTAVQQRSASHKFLCKILTFSNGCILLIMEYVYTKLGDFVNLGVLFRHILHVRMPYMRRYNLVLLTSCSVTI